MGKSFSRLSPRIVNTFFILALQKYFSTHPEYPWSPDDSKTQLDLAVDFDEEDFKQKGLPLVVVQNGPSMISPAGVGSGTQFTGPRQELKDGIRTELQGIWDRKATYVINSSVNIRIVAGSKDDVEELSFEVALFLLSLKYTIANVLQIQNIGSPQIQPPQPIKQDGWSNVYAAHIYVDYSYILSRIWQPVDYGPVLKSIETVMTPVNKKWDKNESKVPEIGDTDEHGNPVNLGEKGGTNTGGQNGNYGGIGGRSDDSVADCVDDNVVELRFRTTLASGETKTDTVVRY